MPVTGPQHQPHRVSSGGAGFNIGPIASIGPGGEHHGRIVGWKYLEGAGIALGSAAVGGYAAARQSKVQDFNDDDTEQITGSARGQPVRTKIKGKVRANFNPPFARPYGQHYQV